MSVYMDVQIYTVCVLYTCGYGYVQDDKKTPGLEKGFLVQIVRYALNRLQSLNEFCVICDEKHVLESGLIKVYTCTCIWFIISHVCCQSTPSVRSRFHLRFLMSLPAAMCVYSRAMCICLPNTWSDVRCSRSNCN